VTLRQIEALRERLGAEELQRRRAICSRLGGHKWVAMTADAAQKYCVVCLACPFLDAAPT
jgi:hypothetical protein